MKPYTLHIQQKVKWNYRFSKIAHQHIALYSIALKKVMVPLAPVISIVVWKILVCFHYTVVQVKYYSKSTCVFKVATMKNNLHYAMDAITCYYQLTFSLSAKMNRRFMKTYCSMPKAPLRPKWCQTAKIWVRTLSFCWVTLVYRHQELIVLKRKFW